LEANAIVPLIQEMMKSGRVAIKSEKPEEEVVLTDACRDRRGIRTDHRLHEGYAVFDVERINGLPEHFCPRPAPRIDDISIDYVTDEDATRRSLVNIWSDDIDMPWDWRAQRRNR
jgi:hypothetical protein